MNKETKTKVTQLPGTPLKIMALIAIIAIAFFACKNDDGGDPPQPHESTITAFGKTATVTGDKSISKGDFETAVGKLQTALSYMDADNGLPSTVRNALTRMMGRNITITTGNAAPADVGGTLTMGVYYDNSTPIENILYAIANSGGFVFTGSCIVPDTEIV